MIARAALRAWYEPRRTAYPWRANPTPFRVLVSEVMLQQTQAPRVVPIFDRFVDRFPDVRALAAASPADVVRAWAGLGYNRRAVALCHAAGLIAERDAGRVPSDPEALMRLPGVGPYTAAAVASMAYGVPVPAVDTNVGRVVARAVLGSEAHEAPARRVADAALRSLDRTAPGGWNQALMDLGREVCRPEPRCSECPLRRRCAFRSAGRRPARRPRRPDPFPGSFRQVRGGVVAALRTGGGVTLGGLSRRLDQPTARITRAVAALHEEGLVVAGPGALAGKARGLVRLPE